VIAHGWLLAYPGYHAHDARHTMELSLEAFSSEHDLLIDLRLLRDDVFILRWVLLVVVLRSQLLLQHGDSPLLCPDLPAQRIRCFSRCITVCGALCKGEGRSTISVTAAVHVRFFEQSRIIRALISSPGLLAPSTYWIDAITFHLAVATRVARKHLPLLAITLLRRAIVAFWGRAALGRVVARPIANPLGAWCRHGESETETV
jgi:hypothetical protein